ncbi:hypothetical protein [Olivibacter jilunii]|uniref:hypothetical protein n=1 Tax=Olivibacter jilunii TaxID=985016 RepID=UPI003F15D726
MKHNQDKQEKDKKIREQDAYSEIEKDPMEGNAHEQDLLEQAAEAATAAYTLDNGVEHDERRELKPDHSRNKEKNKDNTSNKGN